MSSISGISNAAALGPLIPPSSGSPTSFSTASTAVSDAQSISADLQSGNLAAAQQTYSSLTQLVRSVNPSGPTPALDALGQALQSGNVANASKALSRFGKNLAQFLHRVAGNHASQPGAVQQLDSLIANLESIPGVSAASANNSSAGANASSGGNASSGALNLIA
jgi:hypothetical protein